MIYAESQSKTSNYVSINSLIQTKKNNGIDFILPSATTVRANSVNEESEHTEPIQKQANYTGLPDNLKTGLEYLSGFSMNDVRVHYNSFKPAQMHSLAYTPGTDIHVAPGQEKHLPHEAWHVIQQMQGRVKSTFQMKGVEVNDDAGLEREADERGEALGQSRHQAVAKDLAIPETLADSSIIQPKVGFEFETAVQIVTETPKPQYKVPYGVTVFESKDGGWAIKSDNSKVEFVTKEVDDNDSGREKLIEVMHQIVCWAYKMAELTQRASPLGSGKLKDVEPSLGSANQYAKKDIVLHTLGIQVDKVTAAPQATGGVKLDKIPYLIDKMVNVKLEHLKGSSTFEAQHLPPELKKTGDQDNDEFEYKLKKETYEAITLPFLTILQEQGYNIQEISYSVGAESLICLAFLTKAKQQVEEWLKEIEEFANESGKSEEFQREYGIPVGQFRKTTGNLQGLLALVISYLHIGNINQKALPYTKAIATLMSRTNIYALYQLLTPEEKKLFTTEMIFYISGLKDGRLFAGGFMQEEKPLPGPSRSEWIESIIKGTPVDASTTLPFDRLSQGSKTLEALNSTSLGAFKNPDYNPRDQRNNLAVLEIRNIPKNQGVNDWMSTALIILDLFRELNETPEEKSQRLERESVRSRRMKDEISKARGARGDYMYYY